MKSIKEILNLNDFFKLVVLLSKITIILSNILDCKADPKISI